MIYVYDYICIYNIIQSYIITWAPVVFLVPLYSCSAFAATSLTYWLYLMECLKNALNVPVVSDGIYAINLGSLQADLMGVSPFPVNN